MKDSNTKSLEGATTDKKLGGQELTAEGRKPVDGKAAHSNRLPLKSVHFSAILSSVGTKNWGDH
jgi:hypothetical protein